MSQKVLITGGSGMVGRNLLEHELVTKYEILSPGSRDLDLNDYPALVKYLSIHNPDIIIHAAGRVGGILANIQHPVDFLVDNLEIGKNIILAASEVGIKRLLNIASSCMYPRFAKNPLKEHQILTGELEPTNEGYALAKILVTRLMEYLVREDATKIYRTIIPCNLYGRHDKFSPEHSHLIAAIINKVYSAKKLRQDKIEIWGDGSARREFLFAGDLADFIWKYIDKLESLPLLLNVGCGYDHSVNEYYEKVATAMQYKGSFVHNIELPVGMKQKLMDSSQVQTLGWSPATNLTDGITKTIDYYISNYG